MAAGAPALALGARPLPAFARRIHTSAAADTPIPIGWAVSKGARFTPPSYRTGRYTPDMEDTTIPTRGFASFLGALNKQNIELEKRFHGDSPRRQPVHTFNGGAHLFKSDTAQKLGRIALRALEAYAPDPQTLADAIGYDHALAERIYARLVGKLQREPIEDYRIDFEEGFGGRPDEDEDHFARAAAEEMAAAFLAEVLPLGIGIRIKPFSEAHKYRSLRTVRSVS